jgi:LPS export ABC transporter protein LptC
MRHRSRTLLLISLLVTPLGLSACGGADPAAGASIDGLDSSTGYSAVNAEILETDAEGKPRYRLRAAFIEQDAGTTAVAMRNIEMQINDAEAGRWQISAARGSIPAGAREVTLAGEVELNTDRAGSGSLRIRTDELDYDFVTTRALAPGVVTMDLQGNRLEGVGLEADLTRRQIKLKSAIHGEFTR